MNLQFKKPSSKTQKLMSKTALNPKIAHRIAPEITVAEENVKKITQHNHAKIVNSGNSAIMSVMNSINGPFIFPDQGAWSGLKKIANFLNQEYNLIPTEKGLIYPDLLEEYLNTQKVVPSALFLTSFAGYTGEQPIKELYDVCHQNGILLIEDASGSVGDVEKRLCNGTHTDVIIASTGSPKIVNVGNGGFISTNDPQILQKSAFLLKMLRADPITCAGMVQEIKNASSSLSKTIEACNFLKKNILTVFHKDKRGINVIVPSRDPKTDSYKLRQLINADGKSIITKCPLYDRVLEKAVCIEIKNLDAACLNKNTLVEIKEHVHNILF
ncbi:DegT/DnrJ/EryC1/StrS family aminotransferase [Methanobacterium alcaliphilum]|uniref:DegT/DnrJ/EryC1/StrS family aminotransferase n=1 Tax=Methanobacterium alcaliphilum TaxID=392018 RepID=UPI00200AC5A0|nr:DegT/DnrJ/EryC1/StrS family aminotransferase [Methanobacterium alcaliphilum]MCK9152111.1 DegT/DnrJ/EryC1/StrS family aminotransferase [Methanobacterium alcaliphilum]